MAVIQLIVIFMLIKTVMDSLLAGSVVLYTFLCAGVTGTTENIITNGNIRKPDALQ
jgi:hypothetical protein